MAYIDKTYYDDVYKGSPIDDAEAFSRLSERASDSIDQITRFVLKNVEFTQIAQFLQDQVKKAVAAQVEFLSIEGEAIEHGNSGIASVSVGSFNYSSGSGSEKIVSRAMIEHLQPTGLLYRGVDCLG